MSTTTPRTSGSGPHRPTGPTGRPGPGTQPARMRAAWAGAGLVAGLAGLATSYLVSQALQERVTPIGLVAELIIRHTPGSTVSAAEQTVGTDDKPILGWGIRIFLVLAFLGLGLLARRRTWAAYAGFGALFVVGVWAATTAPSGSGSEILPLLVGVLTWVFAFAVLSERLRAWEDAEDGIAGRSGRDVEREGAGPDRRGFLLVGGGIAVGSLVVAGIGRVTGRSRRAVEAARSQLSLPVTQPVVPDGVAVGVDGVAPWMTPSGSFYLIDTAYTKPSIEPSSWSLRIHGMVDKEIHLTYDDLVRRQLTEDWITLNCVSNPVGGPYIGNAWWSGVRLDSLLAEAGVSPDADAVKQTSQDGWTCGTPLSALTDGRNAMLAVAMNGQPLPIDHGFPVRTLVPGLYGYVSACKWVVDMEVTTFDTFSAFWTQRGWGEKGPVKMSSRIDVPRSGAQVAAGDVTFAGTAWSQDIGIAKVEIAVDGGDWVEATLGSVPDKDSWVQWKASAPVVSGSHQVKVRATDKAGLVQTGARQGVLPDGATGWDSRSFSV